MLKTIKTGLLHILVRACILLCFAGTALESAPFKPAEPRIEQITIFVHGVIGLKLSMSLYHFYKLLRDKNENTVYQKTVAEIRNNPFFYENQPINKVGLNKIDIEDLAPGNASTLTAYLYDSVDAYSGLQDRPFNKTQDRQAMPDKPIDAYGQEEKNNVRHTYYTYGWSGLLSQQARESESEEFLTVLENLYAQSRERNCIPKFRLVGFSHGGNLCLQLAHAHKRLNQEREFVIDELIIIGTPILTESEEALSDPLFAHIYNFYSPADDTQKKEVFSGDFFSKRKFQAKSNESLPEKLTQIELHVKKDRIKKNRYTKKEKNFGAIDYSPGHTELWFYGWTQSHYRQDYPLHPLPTVIMTPYIINRIKEINPDHKNIVLTLHPEHNTMSIDAVNMPFLNPHIMQQLKDTARSYAPQIHSHAEYRKQYKEAYWNAREAHNPLPERR